MSEISEQTNVAEQAIKFKKEKVIKGITCPSCNGELDIKEGLRTFNCKYCGTLLTVKGESGTMKYFVPRKIKKEDAIAKTFGWLSSGFKKAKGLKEKAVISESFLVFIPYWRIRADVVGWIFGQEKRTSTSNGRTTTYYVDVEQKIQKSYDRTYSACDVSELGVKKINLTGDTIIPVDFETLQREGMMFNIIASEKEAFDYAKNSFSAEARNSVSLYNVTFEHLDLVREAIDIIYYPLWVVRYNFENRTYQVIIDGEDGSVCYGKAPGNNLYRAVMGILGTGIGMFLITLFGIFVLLDASDNFPFVAYLISVAAGIYFLNRGYKRFRYGGEIEEGTGIEKSEQGKTQSITKAVTSGEGLGVVKDIAASVVIGSVISSLLKNSYKR